MTLNFEKFSETLSILKNFIFVTSEEVSEALNANSVGKLGANIGLAKQQNAETVLVYGMS